MEVVRSMSLCRKIWPAGMTLHARLSLPIMDVSHTWSSYGMIAIGEFHPSDLSVFQEVTLQPVPESSLMPRQVMVVVGPVSLLGFISTPS